MMPAPISAKARARVMKRWLSGTRRGARSPHGALQEDAAGADDAVVDPETAGNLDGVAEVVAQSDGPALS
jgi:hypothetical protein